MALGQRPGCRPPRHRDAVSGLAEPEPLSGGGHPLSAHAPPGLDTHAPVGKTLVSSALIDRVVAELGRELLEVPVGFKWFAPGLYDGSCCFGGEESAGASFLRRDGGVWTTDKDGTPARPARGGDHGGDGPDPGEHYASSRPGSARRSTPGSIHPCTPAEKAGFKRLTPRHPGRRRSRAIRSRRS